MLMEVGGNEFDLVAGKRLQRGVRVVIDRGVENRAAKFVAVRRNVGSATGQSKPQRSSRANQHDFPNRRTCAQSERQRTILRASPTRQVMLPSPLLAPMEAQAAQ